MHTELEIALALLLVVLAAVLALWLLRPACLECDARRNGLLLGELPRQAPPL